MKDNLTDSKEFAIFIALSEENYQINPFYIDISGSITGGYLLTQLVYLSKKWGYGEIFQKDAPLRERLRLSEWELKTQKKELIARGLISIRHGRGNLSYYTVNIDKIVHLAVDNNTKLSSRKAESSDLEKRNPPIRKSGILPTVYKEIDTKQTTLNKDPKLTIIKGDVDNSKIACGAVVDELKKIKIAEKTAQGLIEKHGKEKITFALEFVKTKKFKNPAGYLVKMLNEGWEISKPENSYPIRSVEETKAYLDKILPPRSSERPKAMTELLQNLKRSHRAKF